MAGQHGDAITLLGDLTATMHWNSLCSVVQARAQHAATRRAPPLTFQQAYMYLLLGDSHMESGDYENAIHLFEAAKPQIRNYVEPQLFTISLVSFLIRVMQHIGFAHQL